MELPERKRPVDNDQFTDDPVKFYLTEVCKVPPLSPIEEMRCIQLLRTGGQQAASAGKDLVEANMHVVVAIAERYRNHGIQILDLIHAGNEGLLDAAKTVSDPNEGSFAAYATPRIANAIEKYIASPQERISPVPVHPRRA